VESAVQIFGVYFLCLPTLIAGLEAKGEASGSKREFLRALGCLKRIEKLIKPTSSQLSNSKNSQTRLIDTALSVTDEAMWRSLLIAAGRMSGTKMWAVSVAIFTMMKGAGINANPITYGLYTQALAAGKQGGGVAPKLARGNSEISRMGDSEMGEDELTEDDEWTELETEGRSWKKEYSEAKGVERAERGRVVSSVGSVGSAPPPPPPTARLEMEPSLERPPSPPSRQSSFSSVATGGPGWGGGKQVWFMGGVGMWIKCACTKCGRIVLEEKFIADVECNGTALSDRIKCSRCGGDVERNLHWFVMHTKGGGALDEGAGGDAKSGERSAGAACTGPAMLYDQPAAAKGSVSGVEGIVQVEKTGRQVKVAEVRASGALL
jgi:hypothetical protein